MLAEVIQHRIQCDAYLHKFSITKEEKWMEKIACTAYAISVARQQMKSLLGIFIDVSHKNKKK